MSAEDVKRILENLEISAKEACSSREKALQALRNAGLIKTDGSPEDIYLVEE